MRVPAPFEYAKATSVEHALELLALYGEESKGHRGRPQPAADDEVTPGETRGAH